MTWLLALPLFQNQCLSPLQVSSFHGGEIAPSLFHSSHLSLSDRCLLSPAVGALLASDPEGFTKSRQYKIFDLSISFKHSRTLRPYILLAEHFLHIYLSTIHNNHNRAEQSEQHQVREALRASNPGPRIRESENPKALVYDPSKPEVVTEEEVNEHNSK